MSTATVAFCDVVFLQYQKLEDVFCFLGFFLCGTCNMYGMAPLVDGWNHHRLKRVNTGIVEVSKRV